MKTKTLSVFVDESGNFDDVADPARYCIVTLVFHDQSRNISRFVHELDRANEDLGIDTEKFQFHTAPLIRQEDIFAAMSRRMRGRLLDRMMTFVRNVDIRYRCFYADTSFVNTPEQIGRRLERQMVEYLCAHQSLFESSGGIKVYYDAGQKGVTRLLERVFVQSAKSPVSFVQGVRQDEYKLLQVADLICTARLLELRLDDGGTLNHSELRFFGGPREFKRNILKKLKAKELM